MSRYLTHAVLRRDAPIAALRRLLVPDTQADRTAAAHRLVWCLFGDERDRGRDFLWRESSPGEFYLLSERCPEDPHGMFERQEPKRFEPQLQAGDRLRFMLRANPTVARRALAGVGGKRRGVRADVVMDALRSVPTGERAEARTRLVQERGLAWLKAQGEKSGFSLPRDEQGNVLASATAYHVLDIARSKGAPLQFGVIDYVGTLTVEAPALFMTRVGHGFGRAKAFGCGLMLLRRAR
jgi:CRISPR system Cascade subunit CasE